MTRVMIVPAAGRGSRLRSPLPKVMVPVNGRAMLDYILERYRALVDRFVLVVSPEAQSTVQAHSQATGLPIELAVQETPTGMLDAILIPGRHPAVQSADEIWITWCDQIAVSSSTAERLATAMSTNPAPALALPTMRSSQPYIHFQRDPDGSIIKVLHRREGDIMPASGESDIGLFALSAGSYLEALPRYAGAAPLGAETGERNFLPFIPWLSLQATVVTFPAADPMEAVGINTVEDLEKVAAHLREGARR